MTSIELAIRRPATEAATTRLAASWAAEYRPVLLALPICALILVGMVLGSGPITLGGALLALATPFISPAAGLAVLAFMTPLRSPPGVPAPGFNTLLVGAILLSCVYRLPIDRPSLRPGLPLVLLLAFNVYVGVQQLPELVAGYPGPFGHHIGYLFIQLTTLVAAAVAAALVLRSRPVTPFIVAGLLGAVIAAGLAIGGSLLPAGALANLMGRPDAITRDVGSFGDPNYFGLFLATATAACLALIVVVGQRRLRGLLAAIAVALGIALTVSLSRAALLALGIGILTLAFTRSRRLGLVATAALATLALVVYPLYLEWRLMADAGVLTPAQQSIVLQGSDASRLAAALAGPQIFATSPVFGVGFGHYPLLSGRFVGYPIESHNWYMNVLAEQGLVGIVLWLGMLGALALRLRRSAPAARSVGLAVLVTYAVGSIFLQPPLSVQTSAFAAIVVVAALTGDWSRLRGLATQRPPPISNAWQPPR